MLHVNGGDALYAVGVGGDVNAVFMYDEHVQIML